MELRHKDNSRIQRMKILRKIVKIAAVPLVSLMLSSAACGRAADERVPEPQPVAVQTPASDDAGPAPTAKRTRREASKGTAKQKRSLERQEAGPEKQKRRPIPLSRSEKLRQISERVAEFYGGMENGRYLGWEKKTHFDHINFLRKSRYRGTDGSEGELMFPGIGDAIRTGQYYESRHIERRVARATIVQFARKSARLTSASLRMMELMPKTFAAHIAYLVVNVNNEERLRQKREAEERDAGVREEPRRGGGMTVDGRINMNAEFLMTLVQQLDLSQEDIEMLDRELESKLLGWQPDEEWIEHGVEQLIETHALCIFLKTRIEGERYPYLGKTFPGSLNYYCEEQER